MANSGVKVKNLGLCSAMVESLTEPNNKKVLWYDTSVLDTPGVKCPIKYYDLISKTWEFLVK